MTRSTLLAGRIKIADDFTTRLVGLITTPSFQVGQGLLLEPCTAVHTWFMRYPIDVIYLSASNRVLRVVQALPPFCWGPLVSGASKVLEVPAGVCRATGTQVGDVLEFVDEE
ncbi:MAG: DUF192 domain-containing protein [bacterium]